MTQNERDYIVERLWAIRGGYTVQERPPQVQAWSELLEYIGKLETED